LFWACSDTTLTMDEWLKPEDITKKLFFVQLKLITDKKEGRLFGEKQPRSAKATGALIFGLLIVILLSPLLAMSFLNTQSIPNTPRYADSTLQLFTFEPLYTQENYPAEVNGIYYDVIKRNATGGMRDATQSDIDLTTFSTASQRTWASARSRCSRSRTTLCFSRTNPCLSPSHSHGTFAELRSTVY